MRLVLGMVAAVAACDGGTNNQVIDAGADAPVAVDAPVDALTGVEGTWLDTYITTSGSMAVSVCGSAPSAMVVDATTAAVTTYGGACNPDGSFRIDAPGALGTYYLRVQGALYETTKRAGLDLSTDHLGRDDVAGITGVHISLDMTGLASWQAGDVLMAFAPNVGYYQNLAFTAGGPTNDSTTLAGTSPWFGYKIDATRSDTLQLVQLGVHTSSGGYSYLSLDRAYEVPSLTMANNTMQDVAGAFETPQAATVTLDINVASFNQFATVANPNVSARTIAGSAYAAASPEVIPSPALISFARDSSTIAGMDLGTVAYGDPFPADWNRYVKIQEAFSVPYTWNNVTSSLNAQMTRTMTKTDAEATIVDAKLGPPVAPKFDGQDAFTATNISPVPVVSWSAPTLGTPTDYEILVYEVQIVGTTLKFVSTLRLATKKTSVRIPAGYLLGQRQYVFVIRARRREGSDLYTTPLRYGASTSTAETLTALVTTDF